MLKHPFLNTPYQPKLRYFLSPFDIYDREETLGEIFSTYNIDLKPDGKNTLYLTDIPHLCGERACSRWAAQQPH